MSRRARRQATRSWIPVAMSEVNIGGSRARHLHGTVGSDKTKECKEGDESV